MKEKTFNGLSGKLENNVYRSLKGRLRLQLLLEDIIEHCPEFEKKRLTVLYIGGGSGRFSLRCTEHNHQVLLYDSSKEMLEQAESFLGETCHAQLLETAAGDFLAEENGIPNHYDLVALHGAAEWMDNPEQAIIKAAGYVKPEAHLSLLVFNKDKYLLKRGISGHLLKTGKSFKRHNLTPPGALSPADIITILGNTDGKIICQSGIRIFFNFFRQLPHNALTPDEWLEQERNYYRTEPFRSLGEHTHFIWQRNVYCL